MTIMTKFGALIKIKILQNSAINNYLEITRTNLSSNYSYPCWKMKNQMKIY